MTRSSMTRLPLRVSIVTLLLAVNFNAVAVTGYAAAQREPEAVALAESVMERMGGHAAWDSTHYISWQFFGGRQHYWNKWSGDIRIEIPAGENRQGEPTPARLILMNLNTQQGRAWRDGNEITDAAELREALEGGNGSWINDSYWMFMPYKLLDPGVSLTHLGDEIMKDDRMAEVLKLTFDSVGNTPQNRYHVYVAKDSGLVEQWSYFADRADDEPGFTRPWADWQQFGKIMLATNKGRGADWQIAVHEELPAELFRDPAFMMQ